MAPTVNPPTFIPVPYPVPQPYPVRPYPDPYSPGVLPWWGTTTCGVDLPPGTVVYDGCGPLRMTGVGGGTDQ